VDAVRIFVRWAVTAAALVIAVVVVPGIDVYGRGWIAVIVTAGILALVNTFVRPILVILSCGCIVLTLGVFLLLINAFTLWLSAYVTYEVLGIGFVVEGFWSAFWGGLIVSIVSFIINLVLPDEWVKPKPPAQPMGPTRP
jgi:putative membrane protein